MQPCNTNKYFGHKYDIQVYKLYNQSLRQMWKKGTTKQKQVEIEYSNNSWKIIFSHMP